MKLLLTRRSRIWHEAGETVEVSPAEAGFLLSTGSAVRTQDFPVKETPEQKAEIETPEKKPAAKRTAKK